MQVILRDHVTLLPHHFNGFLHKDALASIEVLLPNITIIFRELLYMRFEYANQFLTGT